MADYFLERLRSQGAWFDAMSSLRIADPQQRTASQRNAEHAQFKALTRWTTCSHGAIGIDSIGDAFCEHCGEDLT
jgi:hypothetical protein